MEAEERAAVHSLEALLESLPTTLAAGALLEGFVPPPRFAEKRFAHYRPDPRHPSQEQALARLQGLAEELRRGADGGLLGRLRSTLGQGARGRGIYLDGGFGVGKTHLLAALWHAAPGPKSYLSFDELVYSIGLLGVSGAREAFRGQRLIAVDEWELDDPGNLKLALAWLRGALAEGSAVAVTSNTIPDDLGRGRFSQKDFQAEIEELSGAFQVLHVAGEDFRHRHFQADAGREYLLDRQTLEQRARTAGERALLVSFEELLGGLGRMHPIRYAGLVEAIDSLWVAGLARIESMPDALRWVHFIDKLYDAAVPLAASGEIALAEVFPEGFLSGPFAKKFGRCLSRMEELLGDSSTP
ncbi:MAG TPA: cell division protein ZapE [Longimicrobiaceae bacterium]|nr:cell division protein ZapE [Longimicrobiaceae bacterium]